MQNARANEPPQDDADDTTLLSSAQVRAMNGDVTSMCLGRWQRDDRVKFPPPDITINGRNYWYRRKVRRWQAEREKLTAEQTAA